MNFFSTAKALLPIALFTLIISNPFSQVQAQSNPYNISTQRGQYFNFQDTQEAMRRMRDRMQDNMRAMQYNRAKDAGDNRNAQLRNEYFFGYALFNADYHMRYYGLEVAATGTEPFDSSTSSSLTPKSAWHFGAGSSYPLATVSQNGALTLSVGLGYNFVKWKLPDFILEADTMSFEIKSTAITLPLTVDFKNGAEALLDRSKKTCFTIGFGVQPTINLAQLSSTDLAGFFSLVPTAKVEFGFATSFCTFKLRATCLFGKQTYAEFADVPGRMYNQNFDFALKGNSQIILALVLMPFTSQWENNEWYRGGR